MMDPIEQPLRAEPGLDQPGPCWGTYVVTQKTGDTALGCGECQHEHWLPTPFLLGDAARLAAKHWQEKHQIPLRRLRLPLDNHASDLLLVGEEFATGARYVQLEIKHAESERWSWLDWDECYDRMAKEWRGRFGS